MPQPHRIPPRHWRATLALAAATACGAAQAVSFELIDLGVLPGGSSSIARGLNNLGQVVGSSSVDGKDRAFVWSPGSGLADPFFPLLPLARSEATAINDSGLVVINLGGGSTRVYDSVTGRFATVPTSGTDALDGAGINTAGRVVGTVYGTGYASAYVSGAGYLPQWLPSSAPGSAGLAINDAGAVAGSSTSGATVRATLWSAGGVPRDLGTLGGYSEALALNGRGQVVGGSAIVTAGGVMTRPFVWQADSGMVNLGSLRAQSQATGINDAGQVVGWGWDSSYFNPSGAFLWSAGSGLVDVNDHLAAGSSGRLLVASAINQLGQIAGQADNGHAALLSPTGDLAWRGADGASFNDGRQWELGLAPSRLVDAQVFTAGAQRITLAADASVNSLGLGGAAGGRPTLVLQGGATLAARYGSTVRATGTLTGDGRVAGGVVNLGTVQAAELRIDGTLVNQGLLTTGAAGSTGRLVTDLDNGATGQVRVGAGEVLQLAGTQHHNAGVIEVRGGELQLAGRLDNAAGGRVLVNGGTLRLADGVANAGEISVGFNGADVFGALLQAAGGRTVLSGSSRSTFYDAVDVQAGGELRVSAGATALFFGLVQQRSGALFTGSGSKLYEGGLQVGASPGLGIDEGSVAFGSANVYRAEIGGLAPGSGFDQLRVAGALQFGGTLQLVAWGGFAAQAGQRFDLFDWGTASGQFAAIDGSGLALAPGLALDVSRLYLDGSVSVSAVPEPQAWALMAAGLAGLGTLVRRRRRR